MVVQLVNIHKEGLMNVESASATANAEIIKEKKTKLIRDKVTGTTIEDIAKNQGVFTSNASAVNMKKPNFSWSWFRTKSSWYRLWIRRR